MTTKLKKKGPPSGGPPMAKCLVVDPNYRVLSGFDVIWGKPGPAEVYGEIVVEDVNGEKVQIGYEVFAPHIIETVNPETHERKMMEHYGRQGFLVLMMYQPFHGDPEPELSISVQGADLICSTMSNLNDFLLCELWFLPITACIKRGPFLIHHMASGDLKIYRDLF